LDEIIIKLEKKVTERGFEIIEFMDRYNSKCSLQKSSLATEDAIWLGVDDANPQIMASKTPGGGTGWVSYPISEDVLFTTRMHLTRKQVKKLLPFLKKFVKTGDL
jgi:hypothetical protein